MDSLFFDKIYRVRGFEPSYVVNPIVNPAIDYIANFPIYGWYSKSYETWTISGKYHNVNSPAVVDPYGNHEWWSNGVHLSPEKEKLLNIWYDKNHTFEYMDL